MADFCNQCAKELGFPEGDLANSEVGPPEPGMGYPELCEGCGPCFVDEKGNCIDPNCDRHHGCVAKAAEILAEVTKRLQAEPAKWHQPCNMPIVLVNEVAKELCGEQYTYDIQQLHDELIVLVKPRGDHA